MRVIMVCNDGGLPTVDFHLTWAPVGQRMQLLRFVLGANVN